MIKARLAAFLADRKGGVIIYVALAMPVLVGGMGLGAETGYRYQNQRLLQHAADVAAHAGAVRKYKGGDETEIDAAALNVAVSSGYDGTVGVIDVEPHHAWKVADDSVEVILTETRPRLFSAIFSEEPVVIRARAVAAVTSTGQPACILALSGTASGAVTITGSADDIKLNGCSVASNSTASDSFKIQGNGGLTTDCVQTSGGAVGTTIENPELTKCEAVLTSAPPVADPYYWVQEPPKTVDSCPNSNNTIKGSGQGNKDFDYVPTAVWDHPSGPVNVMRFCGGLKAQGNITFAPGIYIIDGGTFTANAGAILTSIEVSGVEGVTFYLTNGATVQFNGGATLDLEAPNSGPTSGILFFGDRSDAVSHKILGDSASKLTGAIYMPAAHVEFTGNSETGGGCTQVIANTIELTGNSGLASDCADDGTEEILVGHLISVVE